MNTCCGDCTKCTNVPAYECPALNYGCSDND